MRPWILTFAYINLHSRW